MSVIDEALPRNPEAVRDIEERMAVGLSERDIRIGLVRALRALDAAERDIERLKESVRSLWSHAGSAS